MPPSVKFKPVFHDVVLGARYSTYHIRVVDLVVASLVKVVAAQRRFMRFKLQVISSRL